jgi:NADPH-dependent 2,4-dienoyl-CoA reductase/sulfur reductase-like enzyme
MPERLVVIGGDAGGMAAVSQVRKRRPDLDIVALERGSWTSYSACGIPYLVGGEVGALEDLVARTPQQFRDKDRVDVRIRHEVTAIDMARREVEVRALDLGRTIKMGFDQLLIGTGGSPYRPDLPGIGLPLVHGVQHLDDARNLLEHAGDIGAARVVVVGAGYIGLEMAEAFVRRGARVTMIDSGEQVLKRAFDPDVAGVVADAVRGLGVDLRLGCRVNGFEPDAVLCDSGRVPAELVVLGIGTEPNSTLAAQAGVVLGAKGAIAVDRRQATNLDGVWAAGDCCEVLHLVSGRREYIPLGTYANKQARVAGINIGGGYATFPG